MKIVQACCNTQGYIDVAPRSFVAKSLVSKVRLTMQGGERERDVYVYCIYNNINNDTYCMTVCANNCIYI